MYLGFRKYLWTSLFSSLDVFEGGLHTHESALLVGGRDGGKSVIAMFSSSRHKSLLRAGSTLCCRFCRTVVEPQKNTNVGYKGVFGEGIVRPRMDFVPPSTWHMLYARSSFAFSSSSSNDPYRGDGRDASETKEKKKKTIRVVFVEKTGEEIAVDATVGESVMEAAHQNDVELEGTTCATKVLSDASRSLLLLLKRRRRLIIIAHIYNSHLCFLLFSLATTTTTIHATQARAKGLSRARRVTSSSRTRRCSINFPRRATTKTTCSI